MTVRIGDQILREVTAALVSDKNILGFAVSPQENVDEGPLEILVLVEKVPFDLDGYGRKFLKWRDSTLLLVHFTPQWLENAVEEEAGCWIISGRMLYCKTVHDPNGIFLEIRRRINSVPEKARQAAFRRMMDEASAYPAMILRRSPSMTTASQRTLLKDVPSLARALFLLNGRPPRSERTLLEDMLNLERLPPGIGEITEIIRGLDRYDLKRFEVARKKFEEVMKGIESMSGISGRRTV